MPDTQGVPEIYADFVQIATGELGIFLGFRAIAPLVLASQGPSDIETQPVMPTELKAIVRFNHPGAKAFAIMLKRSLKSHEEDFGEISFPPGFAEQVDLAIDEW